MLGATGIVVGGCRLGPELGRGGAGTVYRATQLGIDRPVAVKLIPAGGTGGGGNPGDTGRTGAGRSAGVAGGGNAGGGNAGGGGPATAGSDRAAESEVTARFEREARAAGALDHPHCLPVYAAGEQDGLLYLVMRLVNGPDLARLIRAQGPLAPARAVALITQVASAVDHAHRAGLVHRDLKPANILIEPDGHGDHAFVSDFGLMRSLADPAITLTGQWVGTPQFAAPEQVRGGDVGPAADIYALGGVLSAALGPTPPAGLSAVVARALERDPDARHPSAGALAAAARAALGGAGTASPRGDATTVTRRLETTVRRRPRQSTARPRGAALGSAPGATPGPARSRRVVAGALMLLICAALGAIAVAVVIALPSGGAHVAAGTTVRAGTNAPTRAADRLVTPSFEATLPRGWTTLSLDTPMGGYARTQVRGPAGGAEADIDHSTFSGQSLTAHAHEVETAAARTPGYRLVSFDTATIAGTGGVVWSFTLAGIPDGQRVDVFRQVGGQLFAVLGSSNSLGLSESAATGIAASITLR